MEMNHLHSVILGKLEEPMVVNTRQNNHWSWILWKAWNYFRIKSADM